MATDFGGDWSKFGSNLIGVWVRFGGQWVFRWW